MIKSHLVSNENIVITFVDKKNYILRFNIIYNAI